MFLKITSQKIAIIILCIAVLFSSLVLIIFLKNKDDNLQEDITNSTNNQEFKYEVILTDDQFIIHEAKIGEWENVNTVNKRIELSEHNNLDCTWQEEETNGAINKATCSLDVKTKDEIARFDIIGPNQTNGPYTILKNSREIFTADFQHGPCSVINSVKIVGNELAIDYIDTKEPGTNSILITEGDQVLDVVESNDYDSAFAPDQILGEFIYIAEKGNKFFVVFQDTKIGKEYDEIYYVCCCDGIKYSVLSNGKYLDFFARKGNDWYHVQAGDLSEYY